MPRRRKIINKIAKKHLEGKCKFCGESDYDLLDCHRIVEGSNGGKYTDKNTVVVCSNCHRKIHSGQIKILGQYTSTYARWVLHYIDENGKEHWGS